MSNRLVAVAKAVGATGLLTETSTRFQTSMYYSFIVRDPIVSERYLALEEAAQEADDAVAEIIISIAVCSDDEYVAFSQ